MQPSELPGPGDDLLNGPTVTPEPAPSDDQLVRLAFLGSAVGLMVAWVVGRWLRRNIVISRRR